MNELRFNPVSTSGVGFKLEHCVQASYLASLLLETPVPFQEGLQISTITFQGKLEARTDDVIVTYSGSQRHYVQSKKGFTLSENPTFYEVIGNMCHDIDQPSFNSAHDKVIIVTDVLNKSDITDGLAVLEWARFSHSQKDFAAKLAANKKKRIKYELFARAIRKAKEDADDEQVWKYLKSTYIKEYDYLETGSKDMQALCWYIHSFIADGQSAETVVASLISYVVEANQHGATLTAANVKPEIKTLFSPEKNPKVRKELAGLLVKSRSSLEHTIHNDIGGFHLDRGELIDELHPLTLAHPFAVVLGDGGMGKSALAKDFILTHFKDPTSVIYFKADQLDRSSLAAALSDMGVSVDFETLLAQWITSPRLLIHVDSFEKLYESDHKEAFQELLGKVNGFNNVSILVTCRTYAFQTLQSKFKLPKNKVGILQLGPLTDAEIERVRKAKPMLAPLFDNTRLKNLVNSPFYLDLAVSVVDSLSDTDTVLNETLFKNTLWEKVIEKKGDVKVGISKLRAKVFSEITLNRAIAKKAFLPVESGIDLSVLESLENEGLLIKHPELNAYAPAHDIFEDMVVARHLQSAFMQKENAISFLQGLDTNPVFRRGIRIWIQELLLSHPEEAKLFLQEALRPSLSLPIVDELLIGILGSNHCYDIVSLHHTLFISSEAKMFLKLYRMCKVAYRVQVDSEYEHVKYKTFGPGWSALLKFYDNHRHELDPLLGPAVTFELLSNWASQFDDHDIIPAEGGIVARHCLRLLEEDKANWRFDNKKKYLRLLFSVAPHALREIEQMLSTVIYHTKQADDDRLNVIYDREFTEMILKETYFCIRLYEYFPDLVIELAKVSWFVNKRPDSYSSNYRDEAFGLVGRQFGYFSASANQTPFRYLFRFHPEKAIDFLIELCNRSTEHYLKSDYSKQSHTTKISFTLEDGTSIDQYGDHTLWGAFRGHGNAPYLVQSALMAFENYMLALAERGQSLSEIFDMVIRRSNSVLPTAVLASVAIAYPLVFERSVLSLLKVREFFGWDLSRYSAEMMSTHMNIGNNSYYTDERKKSDQLKHRRSSMEHLVTQLQFFLPEEVNKIIDSHKSSAAARADELWRLALARMDIRNTEPEMDEERQAILFKPKPLEPELAKIVTDSEEEHKTITQPISAFMWATRALKHPDPRVGLEEWRKNYAAANGAPQAFVPGDPQLSLAAVAIRDLIDGLTAEERKTCATVVSEKIYETIASLKTGHTQSALLLFEKDIFSAVPFLLDQRLLPLIDEGKIKNAILDLLVLLPASDKATLIDSIRENLWQIDPVTAEKCFACLIALSKDEQLDLLYESQHELTPETYQQSLSEALVSIKSFSAASPAEVDINATGRLALAEALLTVPFTKLNVEYNGYLETVLRQFAALDTNDFDNDHLTNHLEALISHFLIKCHGNGSQVVLFELLELIKTKPKFVVDVLKRFTTLAHHLKYPDTVWKHFQLIFYHFLKEDQRLIYLDTLLFGSVDHPTNKLPPNGVMAKMHEGIVSHFSSNSNLIGTVFEFLSGIGQPYQPLCLRWLMKAIPDKGAFDQIHFNADATAYCEAFISQLYNNHLNHIRSNGELLNYFITLLNVLIERGSLLAFRVRDEIL